MVLLKSVDSVSGRWEAVNGIGFEELAHGGVAVAPVLPVAG